MTRLLPQRKGQATLPGLKVEPLFLAKVGLCDKMATWLWVDQAALSGVCEAFISSLSERFVWSEQWRPMGGDRRVYIPNRVL